MKNSDTRASKARAQDKYAKSNRKAKRSIKTGKQNYIDSLVEQVAQAGGSGNKKQLYGITRKLSGKYGKPEIPIKDKERRTRRPAQQMGGTF